MGLARAQTGLRHSVDVLGRRAEERHPGLIGEIEENIAVRVKWRPVVQEQGRTRGQRRTPASSTSSTRSS